jgi:ribosomal protein S6
VIRTYEGMFLVSTAAGEGDKALEPVKRVLDRAGAEVLLCKRWDERKLAYEVGGQKRGIYALTYFKAEGGRIADIERDVQLSEELLRVMILNAEDVTKEEMDKPTPVETGHSPTAELAPSPFAEGGFRDRGDRGGYRGDRDRDDRRGHAGPPVEEVPDALGDIPAGPGLG